eukprot:scaffold137030_cov115-Phaeocystis_antarctica.AAC.1
MCRHPAHRVRHVVRPPDPRHSSPKRAPAPSLSIDEAPDACWQAHRGPELPAGHRGRLALLRLRR